MVILTWSRKLKGDRIASHLNVVISGTETFPHSKTLDSFSPQKLIISREFAQVNSA